MHNLIYLSSASYLFSDQDLIDILTKSRLNNARRDITGLLLYHEGSILQILEGEKEVLNSLFETISRDTRHRSVIKMIDSSISERSFQDWSMGFKQISTSNWKELQGHLKLDDKEQFKDLSSTGSKYVISLIKSFAQVNALTFV